MYVCVYEFQSYSIPAMVDGQTEVSTFTDGFEVPSLKENVQTLKPLAIMHITKLCWPGRSQLHHSDIIVINTSHPTPIEELDVTDGLQFNTCVCTLHSFYLTTL